MASIKILKKDVNYITNEIIVECFTYDYLFPKKNKKELAQIVSDTILFRNNTIKAINSTVNSSSEPIKNQFTHIKTKMNVEIKELVTRLQVLT